MCPATAARTRAPNGPGGSRSEIVSPAGRDEQRNRDPRRATSPHPRLDGTRRGRQRDVGLFPGNAGRRRKPRDGLALYADTVSGQLGPWLRCRRLGVSRLGGSPADVLRCDLLMRAGAMRRFDSGGARSPTRCICARENGAGGQATDTRWGSQPMNTDDSREEKSPGTCPQCDSRIDNQTLAEHLQYCEAARVAAQAALTDSFGGGRR